MPTAGNLILNAAGQRVLGPSGKLMLSDGSTNDPCDCCCVPCEGVDEPARYAMVEGDGSIFDVSRAGCTDQPFNAVDPLDIAWDGTFAHIVDACGWAAQGLTEGPPGGPPEVGQYLGNGPDGPLRFEGASILNFACDTDPTKLCWYLRIYTNSLAGNVPLWFGKHACTTLPEDAAFEQYDGCATGPSTISLVPV